MQFLLKPTQDKEINQPMSLRYKVYDMLLMKMHIDLMFWLSKNNVWMQCIICTGSDISGSDSVPEKSNVQEAPKGEECCVFQGWWECKKVMMRAWEHQLESFPIQKERERERMENKRRQVSDFKIF